MKSKTTNDSNYQAGDIITEDLQELDCVQKSVEVAPAEPDNKPFGEAEHGSVELTTVESKLTEEDMDGDEKKAQVYSPNRKPQNGKDNIALYRKYILRKYLPIVINFYQQIVHVKKNYGFFIMNSYLDIMLLN